MYLISCNTIKTRHSATDIEANVFHKSHMAEKNGPDYSGQKCSLAKIFNNVKNGRDIHSLHDYAAGLVWYSLDWKGIVWQPKLCITNNLWSNRCHG